MIKYSYFNLRVWNLTVLKVWQQQRLAKSLIYPHIIICSTSMQKEGILVRNSYSLIHSKASKLLKRGEAQLENLWWRCGWRSHEVCGKTVIYSRSYSWYGSSVDPKSLKNPRVGVLESRLLITPTLLFTEYIFKPNCIFRIMANNFSILETFHWGEKSWESWMNLQAKASIICQKRFFVKIYKNFSKCSPNCI